MTTEYDATLRTFARTLSDIGHALDSADGAEERIRKVLELTANVVPYRNAALLRTRSEERHDLFVVPSASETQRAELESGMLRLLRLVGHADEVSRSTEPRPTLTLPLIGLDEVIGLLRVDPPDDVTYDVQHLRLLSVVAAQLGAYLTMIRLREVDLRRVEELTSAHDFQQLLVGVVSHDLRNPLSVVIAVAESLMRQTTDRQQLAAIDRALRSARRAARIINDLLDVTHVRVTGGMPVARRPFDLAELLTDLVEDFRLAHPKRLIAVNAQPEPWTRGEWDPDRLSQAITNLINNALQHGEKDAPVIVELQPGNGEVAISVHNIGPAIAADRLGSLFDPFKRGADQVREIGGGLGLGLYIVDQIARSHHGALTVRSTDAEGTTFELRLPTRDAMHAEEAPTDPAPRQTPAVIPLVLVVDDDVDVRSGVAELLELSGYQTVTAAHGGEALKLLQGGLRPTLILLDVQMPVMDGPTFWARCKADPHLAAIPILVISADTASAVKLTREGAAGFLHKPVPADVLLSTISRLKDSDD